MNDTERRSSDTELARELVALREELARARTDDQEQGAELERIGEELADLLRRIRSRIEKKNG